MVFSSIIFLFGFLPLVLTLYLLPGRTWRKLVLLAANLLFYAWGEGSYVTLMVACIGVTWFCGLLAEPGGRLSPRLSRLAFAAGVAFNLGLLLWFKYAAFIVRTLNQTLSPVGAVALPVPSIHLPLGISFFTFMALSYLADVRRGEVPASRSLLNFAVYKSLFPQLIAGPIVRYKDVAGQVDRPVILPASFVEGIRRFIIGLGKKVLIANTVAVAADRIFALPPGHLGPAASWLGIVCYTLQIYFDFAGYSDMAIGLGRMLGFTFKENFDYPYVSSSIREFWRRWHISLSTWFRDYLYVPLGGNRGGELRTGLNLWTVFLLCGLWHGAAWTFVVWGAWHGLFLVLERTRIARRLQVSGTPILGRVYTLLVVMIGWVFFRSSSMSAANGYLLSLAGLAHAGKATSLTLALVATPKLALAMLAGAVGSFPLLPRLAAAGRRLPQRRGTAALLAPAWELGRLAALGLVLLASILLLASGSYNPFIYFRF